MTLLLASLLAFGCTALLFVTASGAIARRERVRRRYGGLAVAGGIDLDEPAGGVRFALDPARLGLDGAAQRALRAELVRAGYFGAGAVAGFATIRLALVALLPALGLLAATALPNIGPTEIAALVLVLLLIGYVLPKASLGRRQRQLEAAYRLRFPDFLDMLVVCINAGLSLEAALDRAGREIGAEDAAFRANLELMAGEMRAGKSTSDALRALAERLGLREARSFAALLRQTIELGTDVAQALTVFSDEMRNRRMGAAEERAAALPPKLTLPLALFIFPVVLIAILAPAVLRILAATAP